MADSGALIIFEGADKTGKSSLAKAAAKWLRAGGIPSQLLAFPGNEPGTLGHLVYEFHHRPENFGIKDVNPLSRQTLHIAAHIDAIERTILPALQTGTWIVLDRFWWSTLVYGLADNVDRRSLELLVEVEKTHWADVLPAIAFLIMRDEAIEEEKPQAMFARLSSLYHELANQERTHHRVRAINNHDFNESLKAIVCDLESVVHHSR